MATAAPSIFDLSTPTLGFGFMRLPKLGGTVSDVPDLARVCELVDRFVEQGGFNFDTAWAYDKGRSENAIRDAVVARYPRESFWVADKLPTFALPDAAAMQERFETSLERCGVDYFDIYLIHNLMAGLAEHAEALGCWDFVRQLKEQGKIRHIGFSFHGTPELLDEILAAHPEVELVQLQLNYADWDDPVIAARACHEVARRHGATIIVMEPLKGGGLATLPESYQSEMRAARPDDDAARWALRFAASLDGVAVVLSGMNDLTQIDANLAVLSPLERMDADECALLARVAEQLHAAPTLACTKCKYCVEGCSAGINIPELIAVLNDYRLYGSRDLALHVYRIFTRDRGIPAACTACGACEGVCPQHLPIMEAMDELAGLFGDQAYTSDVIC